MTLQQLQKFLPAASILVSGNVATYYDFHGVTFCRAHEQSIVEAYVTDVITQKVGRPIRVIDWSDSNNGHFCVRFEEE